MGFTVHSSHVEKSFSYVTCSIVNWDEVGFSGVFQLFQWKQRGSGGRSLVVKPILGKFSTVEAG